MKTGLNRVIIVEQLPLFCQCNKSLTDSIREKKFLHQCQCTVVEPFIEFRIFKCNFEELALQNYGGKEN